MEIQIIDGQPYEVKALDAEKIQKDIDRVTDNKTRMNAVFDKQLFDLNEKLSNCN